MKISEAAKFESDLLKPYEDIPPQSRGIKLQTFRLRGRGASSVPPLPTLPTTKETSVKSRDYV